MFDMFLQKFWNFDHPDPSLGPLTGFPRYLSRFSAWSRPGSRGNQWKTKGNAQNPSFSKALALGNDGFWVQTPHRCKAKYVCKGGWEELYVFLVFWWTFCGFWWTFGCFFIGFSWFLVGFNAVFNGFSWFLHGFSGVEGYCEGKYVYFNYLILSIYFFFKKILKYPKCDVWHVFTKKLKFCPSRPFPGASSWISPLP